MSVTPRNSFIVSTILASIAGATLIWLTYPRNTETCSTKECINAASRILNSMNETADPCNDFYQYACGGWIKNNPIPDDKSRINHFQILRRKNKQVLKDILNSNYTNDREAIKKAKIFYQSCMDEDTIVARGARPVLDFIEKFGGMPLFEDDFDEDSFNLEILLARTFMIVGMGVWGDDRNSSKNMIKLDQTSLTLPNREYYLDEKLRNSTMPALRKFMNDYLVAIWKVKVRDNANQSNFDEEKVKNAVEEIIQFETDLAEILVPKEERTNITELYNKMTLQDMTNDISSEFNWYQFVREIMSKADIKIEPTTEVVVYGRPYFTKFMSVLKRYENRVIKNYVLWVQLHNYIGLLSKEFRDTRVPYRKALSGITVEPPRFETCVSTVHKRLTMPVGALYVKEKFSKKSKEMIDSMSADIIKSFKDSLSNLTWMDDETKENAEIKADSVMQLVGYPYYIGDDEDPKLDEDHANLSVFSDKYFENVYNGDEMRNIRSLRKLLKPVQRDEWRVGPAVVNAYYYRGRNIIVFPAGILQSPFYDIGNPFAMNYGAIGSFFGHELTHGFDTGGSQYDGIGNLMNWWSNSSQMNFDERADCIEKQYGGFFYEPAGLYVKGNATIGENIADNGGIRKSYEAYQLWKKTNPNAEFILPGLEKFTPEQLFFLGNAQMWCTSEKPEFSKWMIVGSVHSPMKFRVEGTFMNFEKFGEAYNCKQGQDRLYPEPEDTCRVW